MTDVLTEMSSPGKQLSFLLACLLAPAILGLSLNNCGGSSNDKTAEVVRGENSIFTCTLGSAESSHTLEWTVNTGSDTVAGTCPSPPSNSDTCTNKLLDPVFIPRRTEKTRSVMTVDPTKANQLSIVESGTLICKDKNSNQDSCLMDYITPASGTCSSRVDTDTLKVKGDCNITRGNSSRGRYMCQWYRKQNGTTDKVAVTSLIAMTSNTLPTGSARCPVSQSLRDLNGVFTYIVTFLPGRQFFTAGTVQISRPATPNITCTPTGYVKENSTLTCMCTTGTVGQPAGRLQWLRGSSDVIVTGDQGVNRLGMSQTLNRSDDGVTQFHCGVDWSDLPLKSTVYTASVGYPPSTSDLFISPSSTDSPDKVSENTTVTFTCHATGGNPPSTMTLSNATSTLRSGPSTLTFDLPSARCEHSGVYTCTGSNDFGQPVINTTSLFVLCSPRSASKIPALNFINNQVETSFSVTGYPVPTLDFSYLGRSENTTGNPRKLPDSIRMNGRCVATRGIVHQSTCTITVYNVTSDEAAGIYQVNVSNTQGKTDAMFEVKYRAPVPPSEEPSSGNAAVIGGVVGAVVVAGIIAVVVVVVIVWKSRKGPDKKHSRSTAAGRPKNGQGRNSYREMDEPGLANADPEASSRPLSFAPMAVYAQVDKKQKNSKAAAAPGANGGQPADVYPQVDTTKKSNQGAAAPETEVNGGHPVDVYAVVEKTKKKEALGAGAKPKTKAAGKPKKEKKKNDKRDESAHVYGNVEKIQQGKAAKAKKTTKPSKEETSSGKMVNPEGLIYTSVEFSQPPKAGKPAARKPEEEPVVYSAVDFKKSPPAP